MKLGPSIAPPTVTIPGSEAPPHPGFTPVGPAPADRQLQVLVSLTPTNEAEGQALLKQAGALKPGDPQRDVLLKEAQADFDPPPQAKGDVDAFIAPYGLTDSDAAPVLGNIHIHGSVAQMEQAFGVTLQDIKEPQDGQVQMTYSGPIYLPQNLGSEVQAVLGLDTTIVQATPIPPNKAGDNAADVSLAQQRLTAGQAPLVNEIRAKPNLYSYLEVDLLAPTAKSFYQECLMSSQNGEDFLRVPNPYNKWELYAVKGYGTSSPQAYDCGLATSPDRITP
jgi:hypothetical protein